MTIPSQAALDVLAERKRQIDVEDFQTSYDDNYTRGQWRPKDRRRDLVRAAALIIAEIERLDRAAAKVEAETTPTDIEPSPDDASLNQGT